MTEIRRRDLILQVAKSIAKDLLWAAPLLIGFAVGASIVFLPYILHYLGYINGPADPLEANWLVVLIVSTVVFVYLAVRWLYAKEKLRDEAGEADA